jgi:hypothetical protein
MAFTTTPQPITAGPNRGTFSHASTEYLETASSTFKKGAPIIFTSGLTAEAGTTPVAGIVGFAEEAGNNVAASAANKTRVLTAQGGAVFEGTFGESDSSVALAQAQLGVNYGLTKDPTSGIWYVDKGKVTTDACVTIVGFRGAVGDTDARVYFVVRNSMVVNA